MYSAPYLQLRETTQKPQTLVNNNTRIKDTHASNWNNNYDIRGLLNNSK